MMDKTGKRKGEIEQKEKRDKKGKKIFHLLTPSLFILGFQ